MRALQRIAHVDDDDSIRAVTRVALEKLGKFTLLSCASGAEALEKIPEFKPDLILLDVMMPEVDGPATLAQLQQAMDLSAIPVLFMTAKVQRREIEHYCTLGACDVIIKPFDPMLLAEQLKQQWQQFHGE